MKRTESLQKTKQELIRQSHIVVAAGLSTLFISGIGILSFLSSRSLLVFTGSIYGFAYGARCINDFRHLRKHIGTHRLLLNRKKILESEKEARIVRTMIIFALSMTAMVYALKYYSKLIVFNPDIMFGYGLGSAVFHITCLFIVKGNISRLALSKEYSSLCLQCVGVDLCILAGSMLLEVNPATALDFVPALALIGTVLTKNFQELLRL